MNDITLNIVIGIFTGIITSLMIWISIEVFKKILIPWYQKSIFRGINISGEWTAKHTFLGNVVTEQNLELKQNGHKIKGTLISRNKIPSKGEDTTSFSIVGEIFDNYVDLEYKINDNKYIGRGSLLLRVKEGGAKLEGGLVAIDRFTTDIMTSDNISWERKK